MPKCLGCDREYPDEWGVQGCEKRHIVEELVVAGVRSPFTGFYHEPKE